MVDASCEWIWEVSLVQVSGWNIYCVFGVIGHALLHFSWGSQAIQINIQILSRYEIAQVCLAIFSAVHFDGSFITLRTILFQQVKKLFIRFSLGACQVHFVEVETFA